MLFCYSLAHSESLEMYSEVEICVSESVTQEGTSASNKVLFDGVPFV